MGTLARFVLSLTLLAGCHAGGGGSEPTASTGAEGAEPGTEAAEATAQAGEPEAPAEPAPERVVPRCGALEGDPQPLLSVVGVAGDSPVLWYATVVYREPGEWAPDPFPRMPYHHATRIEWTNVADLPLLQGHLDERMRFTFRMVSREIAQVPGQHAWRTTYRAQIETACSESADASRAEGVHVPNIEADTAHCPGLEAAVAAAAREVAACQTDGQCTVVHVNVCDVDGVGCYYAPVNAGLSQAPLTSAIYRLLSQGCPIASCDCPRPPATARCEDGLCVAP